MTKEKWNEIHKEESDKFWNSLLGKPSNNCPSAYVSYRKCISVYLESMDKATEVFFMENPKEKK